MMLFATALEVLLVLALIGGQGSSSAALVRPRWRWDELGTSRPHSVSITEFGGVGDGITLNTKAFQNAIFYLQSFADKGGAQLFVPRGKWLTGSFSLVSHLTLSLDKEAAIIGSVDSNDWPIIDPLPSYGRGMELPGGRHQSLIHAINVTDVIITGDSGGTIDGQGSVWWDRFRNETLDYTRPHLIELMHSSNVVVSNVTLMNSPFWAIHPVYCSHVLIHNVTVLAPPDSPNTDGIDPDSSEDISIEDCYISTGGDAVAIKSGWDEYGTSFGRPSRDISIQRIVARASSGSGICLGSEMSGGISRVRMDGARIFSSKYGIRIPTSPGRGGYIRDIRISDMVMEDVDVAIRIQGDSGEHPDDKYDPGALPIVSRITIDGMVGKDVSYAGVLEGIRGDEFRGICLSNVTLDTTADPPWKCSYVQGYSILVSPEPCQPLQKGSPEPSVCYMEEDNLLLLLPQQQQQHSSHHATFLSSISET